MKPAGARNYPKGATCAVDGCQNMVHAQSLCSAHYSRLRRHGSAVGGGIPRRKYVTERRCAVDGCVHFARKRGWCETHYMRFIRHGDPAFDDSVTVEQRFWSKVEKTGFTSSEGVGTGECWIFRGAHLRGYGIFWAAGSNRFAHRWAYEQLVGPIPEGMTLDHLCYTRNCVRPEHLEPVTSGENVRRSRGKIHYVVLYETKVITPDYRHS